MPKAYSYIRFSTSKQELGDSLRRQMELAEKYAAKQGLELDTVSYRDLGVSAFKRRNLKKGALAAFIQAVKSGKIEKGSYLLVEQFDRLSRADIDVAVMMLLELVHSGIILVTLEDEKIWNETTVKDMSNLMLSIAFMSRANNESAAKARRLSSIWERKKALAAEKKTIATRECPRWLKVNSDKTAFIIIDDRVESIKKVFSMRIQGHGVVSIVNRANKERWPAPAKRGSWHTSLVGRLLRNRALLGEYQPHKNYDDDGDTRRTAAGDPVPNFYPAVIDEKTFLLARAVAERKGRFPGRRDPNHKNWLQGLLRCSCGKSLVRKNKGADYARYYCTGRVRGLTNCPSVGTKLIEDAVIGMVATASPQHFVGSVQADELKTRLDILAVELSAAKDAQNRFIDAVGQSRIPIPALVQQLSISQEKVLAVQKTIEEKQMELAELTSNSDVVFENIVTAIKNMSSSDGKAALREDLSRFFLYCRVFVNKNFMEVVLRNSNTVLKVPLAPHASIPGIDFQTMTDEDFQEALK